MGFDYAVRRLAHPHRSSGTISNEGDDQSIGRTGVSFEEGILNGVVMWKLEVACIETVREARPSDRCRHLDVLAQGIHETAHIES